MFEIKILFLNLVSTLFMTGVIWFVQITHYPLFIFVSKDCFSKFSILHSKYSSFVVIIPMLIELFSSLLLLKWSPQFISYYYFLIGFILVLIIWLSTFILQIPAHRSFLNGYDQKKINYLVKTNWIRTLAWSFRTVLMTFLIYNYVQ